MPKNPQITLSLQGLKQALSQESVKELMLPFLADTTDESLTNLASELMLQGLPYASLPASFTVKKGKSKKNLRSIIPHADLTLVNELINSARVLHARNGFAPPLVEGSARYTALNNYTEILCDQYLRFAQSFPQECPISKRDFYLKYIYQSIKHWSVPNRKWSATNLMSEEVIFDVSFYVSDLYTQLSDDNRSEVIFFTSLFYQLFKFPQIDLTGKPEIYAKLRRALNTIKEAFPGQWEVEVKRQNLMNLWLQAAYTSYKERRDTKQPVDKQIRLAIGYVCGKTYEDENTAMNRFISLIKGKTQERKRGKVQ